MKRHPKHKNSFGGTGNTFQRLRNKQKNINMTKRRALFKRKPTLLAEFITKKVKYLESLKNAKNTT